jgi:hypothetical protein
MKQRPLKKATLNPRLRGLAGMRRSKLRTFVVSALLPSCAVGLLLWAGAAPAETSSARRRMQPAAGGAHRTPTPHAASNPSLRFGGPSYSSAALKLFNAAAVTPTANSIDSSQFFVRQHYLDFLNREPDARGLQFWTGDLDSCGADAACLEVKKVNVSAAFFLSIEFQQTGYLVYRAYQAAYGRRIKSAVPLTLREFIPDTQAIGRGVVVGAADWERQVEANQQAFFDDFVLRPQFLSAYPATVSSTAFIDSLNANTGGSLSQAEHDTLVSELDTGVKTRAQALRAVCEDTDFSAREKNRAFVLMQYYGYLRRNPDDAPEPGRNFGGWNFWLGKLDENNGNFVQAEMVKAFITSTEYRQRFGQP